MNQVPVEISNFFLAMQAGQVGADALAACFAPDAVYVEPFTGVVRRHEGIAEVMQAMALGWEMPMLDTRIQIDRVSLRTEEVLVWWTCFSPSIPGGQGSGCNRFVLEAGRIVSLITTMDADESEH